MLGGGPASQHPRSPIPANSRAAAPCCHVRCHRVIHSCYAFSSAFFTKIRIAHPRRRERARDVTCLTMRRSVRGARLVHQFKTTVWIARRGETPLSGAAAPCPQDNGDCRWTSERLLDEQGRRDAARPGVRDAERSDAVDGVRHQFSRAGPDLGLRARAPIRSSRPRGSGPARLRRRAAARAGDAAPAVRRSLLPLLAGGTVLVFAALPRRHGHPALLRPAGRRGAAPR